ncbi:MAG TPA: tetratricopeptide repeat protein [Blastocatellia bacterium]|nr:tetratricopeptide repeat protein [Blastocatellia bacterium]
MQSLKHSLIAAVLLSFAGLTAALGQPGDYVQRINAVVNELQRRIAEANLELDKEPTNIQLYAKRGSLYVDLYHALHDESGLGRYYGDKTPELSKEALITKAISDLDRAIGKSPSVDLLTKRGEMREARWNEVALHIYFSAWRMKDWPYTSWEHVTEAPTDQLERAILDRVLTNQDFESASEDYSEALRLNKDAATAREIHTRLARLYFVRAQRMPLGVPLVRATVIRPNMYRYSLLEDYDKAIEHIAKGNELPSTCKPFAVRPGQYLCDYYSAKAGAAAELAKYEIALQAFSAAENYIEPDDNGRRCQLYAARRDLHAKMKNYDAALAEVAKMNSPPANSLCADEAYGLRADAAFEKGDWRAATGNYSEAVKNADSGMRSHLNLIRAYLNLGEPQAALQALKRYCGIGCADEFLELQARAHQMSGQTALAASEMKTFRAYRAYLKNEQTLEGKLRIRLWSPQAAARHVTRQRNSDCGHRRSRQWSIHSSVSDGRPSTILDTLLETSPIPHNCDVRGQERRKPH